MKIVDGHKVRGSNIKCRREGQKGQEGEVNSFPLMDTSSHGPPPAEPGVVSD